jgi:TraM recognition site of TraD and TraG
MARGDVIMSNNPVIRFITENKKVPHYVNIFFHAISLIILYSFFLMTFATFILHPEWSGEEFQKNIPLLGFLAPYSFYTVPNDISYIWGAVATVWIWGTWIFSTRVQFTNKSVSRRAISFLITWASFVSIILLYSLRVIKEIGYEKVVAYHYTIASQYQEMMHVGALQMVGYLLMLIPVFVFFSFSTYLYGQYKGDKRIQEWFRTYKFESGWIGRFGEEAVNKLPDIQLARNAETNAPVILQGESRQLGTLLIGPPGSGKTSIKIKTSFRTDLGHLQRMINAYPTYVKRYGYGTEKFISKMANHLIGSIIIEPAKDLCDDAYELAREHGIPEEFIVYLDPSNKNTPGFNMMVGPTGEIVETIAAVLEAIAETKDEFFKQAARAVLKHYVYLLKLTRGDNCNLLDLDDLYQDPRKAMDMLEELEKTLPPQEKIDALTDNDEKIHWIIVKKIVRWFRNEGLAIEVSRDGMLERYEKGHDHEGKPKVRDLQFEFTRQTRNLLSDITKNPYLARILYAENAVNLNRLFKKGGILLVNTDLGNLKDLSAVFGKIVLLSVQNAVFRRKGNEYTRPLVSFYADEFYDYMNERFLQLTSQGRKYKFAPLVACQSLTQFGVKFGKDFTESMLGTIRNTIVYGGTSVYDTEMLSKYLGTEVVEELQIRESYSPSNMESPSYSISESVTQKEKEIATSDDIMFQEFKFSYIRMVDNKSSKKAIRAEGDFVDTSDANRWKKALSPQALETFLNNWRMVEQEETVTTNTNVSTREELDQLNIDQEAIRTKQVIRQETITRASSSRFKAYTHQSVLDVKENLVIESKKEAAAAVGAPRNYEQLQIPLVETDPKQRERVDVPKPQSAIESPFSTKPTERKEKLATISFSSAFGSKDKERLAEIVPQKKEAVRNSTSLKVEAGNLEEVTLDENALKFINQFKVRD